MLMIHIAFGLGYCAEVANTGIRYVFAGADPYEQMENVQAFAESLAEGNAGVGGFFNAQGVPPGLLDQQLFGDTTSLMVDGEITDFAASLMDNLEMVGEILLEALVG